MAVRVDEAGHDRHALRVDDLRPRGREVADVARRADRDEPSVLHGERFGARLRPSLVWTTRVDDDEIGFDPARRGRCGAAGLRSLRQGVEGERAGQRGAKPRNSPRVDLAVARLLQGRICRSISAVARM